MLLYSWAATVQVGRSLCPNMPLPWHMLTCPPLPPTHAAQMLRLPRALRGGLRKPVIEGSTRYAGEGPRMAKGLHEVRGSCRPLGMAMARAHALHARPKSSFTGKERPSPVGKERPRLLLTADAPPPPLIAVPVQVFPWIKLVASVREPISRAVAVLASARDEASQRCLAE